MAWWYVPVNITEIGRFVVVEAETPADAARKARRGEWERLTEDDAKRYKVTKGRGKIEQAPDEQ